MSPDGRRAPTAEFYNAADEDRYGRADLPQQVRALRRLLARHGIGADELVVDLGCGKGPLRGLGARYLGVDLSHYALSRFRGTQWSVQGDAQEVPVRGGAAALVVSTATLEHLPAPERCLAEIDRMLRPGGLAYLAPAWFCRPWAARGVAVRPYAALPLRDRITKALLPMLDSTVIRGLWIIPVRILREIRLRLRRGPLPLAYRRLEPNLREYLCADSDASAAIDPHAVIAYFLSRGYDVPGAPSLRDRILFRYAPVVVRKGTRKVP
ncbi:MAG TPA: class I SAM-dependent methyltransferase [bacterium]|nr:class I SAM-dependent methyltransferase [bacterium]